MQIMESLKNSSHKTLMMATGGIYNEGPKARGEESRASPHRSRTPALCAPNQYKMAALWSKWFSISTVTMKPLAAECRLGKYNFNTVLVVLL